MAVHRHVQLSSCAWPADLRGSTFEILAELALAASPTAPPHFAKLLAFLTDLVVVDPPPLSIVRGMPDPVQVRFFISFIEEALDYSELLFEAAPVVFKLLESCDISSDYLDLLKLSIHCVPDVADLARCLDKFAVACAELPAASSGFLFVAFETNYRPPSCDDAAWTAFFERVLTIAAQLATLLAELGECDRSADLWFALFDFSPIFFDEPLLDFSVPIVAAFFDCVARLPLDSPVLHETVSELCFLFCMTDRVDVKTSLLELIVAIGDHCWSLDLNVAVRDLAKTLSGEMAFSLAEKVSEPTPEILPVVALMERLSADFLCPFL
jgi:hypothetical protein